ncbi:unnamed protein product [Amaranthus hypochondriacus]
MSIFSSFDLFCAESNGWKLVNLSPLKASSSASTSSSSKSSIVDGLSKENCNTNRLPAKNESGNSQHKLKKNPRFALELDGVHCFETIVPN